MTLGRRSGYVISCCIPLILLGSFCAMFALGIDLHKVSLGALVVSLGMLVDDAIVVVELMEVKMSEGMPRKEAAPMPSKPAPGRFLQAPPLPASASCRLPSPKPALRNLPTAFSRL